MSIIMFADVAGYTAMMQRNEKEGFAKVQRFQAVVETEVKTYHGEILEVRGDGCMVVFDSAVQAMYAAKAIQEQLQQKPIVPLRIGIHIGDIIFANGSIYGDGVNLASRVESMGIPGSVLVTERVIHDIKSHPEFEMNSLGKFQFKNVEKPMEVFALANEGLVVPKSEEMKGKGEKISDSETNKDAKRVLRGVLLGTIGFIVVLGVWLGISALLEESSQTESIVVKDNVSLAILPFEDLAQDPQLSYLGYGLREELITEMIKQVFIL